MVYFVLKEIFRPALRLFYTPTVVTGRAHVAESGPLVIVANHPNTLMDPLLVGMRWRRQVHFLTKSVFFRGLGGWILRTSGAIPVYRQEELKTTAELSGAEWLARNDASFRATHDLLGRGGALLIFPEGSSVLERRLRPFKAGGARIALGAEARHGWTLGVRILPVGLNYTAADRFRSPLCIRIGAPIKVTDWRAAYEANPTAAARSLTEAIRRALAAQLLVPHSPADEALLPALAALVKAPAPSSSPARAALRTLLFQRRALQALQQHDPVAVAALRDRLLAHYTRLRALGLAHQPPNVAPRLPFWHTGRLALAAPLWVWGVTNHWPATQVPARLSRRLTRDAEFRASIKMVFGIFTVPLFYCLQAALVWRGTGSGFWTAAYLLSLPVAGLTALQYPGWWHRWQQARRLRHLQRHNPAVWADLQREGNALRDALRHNAPTQTPR